MKYKSIKEFWRGWKRFVFLHVINMAAHQFFNFGILIMSDNIPIEWQGIMVWHGEEEERHNGLAWIYLKNKN